MSGQAPTFTPSKVMDALVQAAWKYGRGFQVSHGSNTSGNPYMSFTCRWWPQGSSAATEITFQWDSSDSGRFRVFYSSAKGFLSGPQPVTTQEALQLISGKVCYYADARSGVLALRRA